MSNTFNPIRPVLIGLNNIAPTVALYVILHPQRSVFEFSLIEFSLSPLRI